MTLISNQGSLLYEHWAFDCVGISMENSNLCCSSDKDIY